MQTYHIERLQQVVRVLRELPKDKKLDLGLWYQCGSTACAIGWAAADPWFNKKGLRLSQNYLSGNAKPQFRRKFGFDAVSAFFGLTSDEENFLFINDSYRRGTRGDVIRRLEAFIHGKTRE